MTKGLVIRISISLEMEPLSILKLRSVSASRFPPDEAHRLNMILWGNITVTSHNFCTVFCEFLGLAFVDCWQTLPRASLFSVRQIKWML